MTNGNLRFAVVASTAGSVMHEVLKNTFFRARVQLVVTDRAGPAYDKAHRRGIPTIILAEDESDRFCARLLSLLEEHEIDYVFSFYTKFFSADVRSAFRDRILNFHPSLLPAFKGLDGFGDTVAYPARFAGNTVEFIAEVMDEGKIIMQTVCPVDECAPLARTRHRVFVQQCQALLQTAHWLQQGRITVDGNRVIVAGATFDSDCFSPALDSEECARWLPPDPDEART